MRTKQEFNEYYKNYLSEEFYGLTIEVPSVVHYLHEVFQDLTKIEGFKYHQIKTEFGIPKVYTNLDEILPLVGRIIHQELEDKIMLLLKVEYELERRLLSLNLDKNGKPFQSL